MLKTVFMSPYSRVLPLWLPLIASAHTIPESMQFVLIVLVPYMTLGGSTMLRLWGATNMCVIYTICSRYTKYPIKCAQHLVLLCLFGVILHLICRFLWVNSPVLLGLPQCQEKDADSIFKCTFFNKNFRILNIFFLRYVPQIWRQLLTIHSVNTTAIETLTLFITRPS